LLFCPSRALHVNPFAASAPLVCHGPVPRGRGRRARGCVPAVPGGPTHTMATFYAAWALPCPLSTLPQTPLPREARLCRQQTRCFTISCTDACLQLFSTFYMRPPTSIVASATISAGPSGACSQWGIWLQAPARGGLEAGPPGAHGVLTDGVSKLARPSQLEFLGTVGKSDSALIDALLPKASKCIRRSSGRVFRQLCVAFAACDTVCVV
jgi:hypothetical protein